MAAIVDTADQHLAEAKKDEVINEKPVEKAVDEKSLNEKSVESVSHVHEDDGIHDGLVFPTEEELATLRRVSDTIPWNAYLIAFVELAERFSFYGSSVVFTNFIQQPLPEGSRTGSAGKDGQPGALGLGQRASTGLTTFYQFWCYLMPLFGAYVADTRLGRFKTICWSVAIAMVGHIIMIISAVPGVIEKPKSAAAAFAISLIIMGIGTGGFKANISPLVAEQYKRTKLFVETTKSGEKVIVDPTLTASRIYMYFYLFINIGALVGQISMTYTEKYVGFWAAYTLPTIVFCLCPIVLYLGRKRYVRSPPTGSVLASALHILRYCAKGQWSLNPARTWKNFKAPDFWDKAKPSQHTAANKPSWMHFDDAWVDEVKRGFKACGVFLWFPLYWLTYNQLNNNLTSQAATMTTNGLPNDVLSNLNPFSLIILIPVCDLFIYPGLRKVGLHFTPLKRMAAGFFTGTAAMIWAAVVQAEIYKSTSCGKYISECEVNDERVVSPLNVWIQSGSYILIAISEIFASISGLEYAFTKAPKNMRSLVMSVFLFMSAVASAIGQGFVALSSDPLLVWNYGSVGVVAFIGGVIFVIVTRKLDKQEDELNNLDAGRLD